MTRRFRTTFIMKSAAAILSVVCLVAAVIMVAAPVDPAFDAPSPDVPSGESLVDFYGDDMAVVQDDERFDGASYVADAVLVDLVDWAAPEDAASAFDQASGRAGFAAGPTAGDYTLFALPEGLSVAEALELLEGSPLVGAVQPDFVYCTQADEGSAEGAEAQAGSVQDDAAAPGASLAAAALPQDALSPQSEDFAVNDPRAGEQWAIDAMNLEEAWEIALDAGAVSDDPAGTKRAVAVIDEGFLTTHEDMGKVVDTYNSYDGTSDVSPIQSDSHGTHVAGIVGARTNNAVGIAGVSYNAQLQLVKAAKNKWGTGSFTASSLVAGINHVADTAARYGTRVVNISVGGYAGPVDSFDQAMKAAIDDAFEQGIVVVCSAGNQDTANNVEVPYVNYPSDYPTAVSVIGLSQDSSSADGYVRGATSNYNMDGNDWGKDVSAPGTGVMSLLKSGSYGLLGGTSMAAPQVSGVLSLMFAVDPTLTADEAVGALCATAVDLNASNNRKGTTFDDETGYGLVNAQDAVGCLVTAVIKGKGTVQRGKQTMLSIWPRSSAAWTWSSSDGSVARVDASGIVTGVGEGSAVVTATRVDDPDTIVSRVVSVYDPKVTGPSLLAVGATGASSVSSTFGGTWDWSSSNASVAQVDASSGKVVGKAAGTATITAKLAFNPSIAVSYTVKVEKRTAEVTRIAGATALDTMRAIVQAGGWPSGGTVVLATDGGYWDGLTANGVAGLADAPIVLTDGSTLSAQAKAVIAKLRPTKVIACGGAAAISDGVLASACAAAGTSPASVRLWGQKADDTAREIYAKGASTTGGAWAKTAFVCTDNGYWDALSAAPASYAQHMPIFLTTNLGEQLSSATLSAMKKGGVTGVYVVGGTAAVAEGVEGQLGSYGIEVLGRLGGADAVDTSLEVAQFSCGLGLSADGLGVATSSGYWDALSGAALCGRNGAALVIVDGPQAATISGFVAANAYEIENVAIFGGVDAVSSATETAIKKALAS